jgi:hypothetical protein
MKNFFDELRAFAGGAALALGCFGLLFFAVGVPFSIFLSEFWTGMGFREGPQPSAEKLQATADASLQWSIVHRLVPLFLVSVVLIGWGFYEALKEKERGAFQQ